MSDRWKMLWTCWLLPAGVGAAVAGAVVGMRPVTVAPAVRNTVPAQEEERAEAAEGSKCELPAGQQALILAAQGGRTAEARQALAKAMEKNPDDLSEPADLLAAILVTDPGYLEVFLKTMPDEKRRDKLALGALDSLSKMQPDGFWQLVQGSPDLLALIQKPREESGPELGYWAKQCMTSPLAVQVLFDPALGFTPEQAAKFCMARDVSILPETAARVLDEWRAGRWPESGDACGKCLRKMWLSLGQQEPEKLQEFMKSLPPEQARKYATYAALMDPGDPAAASDPPVEKLALLDSSALEEVCAARSQACQPVPLDTLAQLPKAQRGWALTNYSASLIFAGADAIRNSVAQLDALPLDREEKQDFLMQSANLQWGYHQDAATALDWLSRLPEEGQGSKSITQGILQGFAVKDPQAALDYAATMPPGPDRDRLTKEAQANLPR